MSTTRFSIAYTGEAVQDGSMSAKDVGGALLAVGALFDAANEALNGSSAKVDIQVNATATGSFEVDLQLAQTFVQQAVQLFGGETITAALQLKDLLLGREGLISLIQQLRGRNPNHVALPPDGNLRLSLGRDTLVTVDPRVWQLHEMKPVRDALRGILEPLRKDGIGNFEVRSNGDVDIAVSKDEIEYFEGDPDDEELTDNVHRAALVIVSLTFKEGNKWRLFDGNSTISADILDTDFLERVAGGAVVFRSGDVLDCNLRVRQIISGGRLRMTYTVEEVIDHRRSLRQEDLFPPD